MSAELGAEIGQNHLTEFERIVIKYIRSVILPVDRA
jgi:hypothetical protein